MGDPQTLIAGGMLARTWRRLSGMLIWRNGENGEARAAPTPRDATQRDAGRDVRVLEVARRKRELEAMLRAEHGLSKRQAQRLISDRLSAGTLTL